MLLFVDLAKSNYKLQGRTDFHGINISIENRAGSVRSGVDKDGHRWETRMVGVHYGRIIGIKRKGADKEHLDVFLKAGPTIQDPDQSVYVIHLMCADNPKKFDEDKCFLNYRSAEEARQAFNTHYDKVGQKLYGGIIEIRLEKFKEKLNELTTDIIKSHVHGYTRQSKTGRTAFVHEHDDSRQKAQPTIQEKYKSHIDSFLEEAGDHVKRMLTDTDWSKGECETVARDLAKHLRNRGVKAACIGATGFKKDIPDDAHPDWKEFKGKEKYLWHGIVYTGDAVIDLTGSQYGKKYSGARVLAPAEFKEEWSTFKTHPSQEEREAGASVKPIKLAKSLFIKSHVEGYDKMTKTGLLIHVDGYDNSRTKKPEEYTGTSASSITEHSHLGAGITLGDIEQKVLSKHGVKDELEKLLHEQVRREGQKQGISTFEDWLNPCKIGARLFSKMMKAGQPSKEAREALKPLVESYTQAFYQTLGRPVPTGEALCRSLHVILAFDGSQELCHSETVNVD